MLSNQLQAYISEKLTQHLDLDVQVLQVQPISGGDINAAFLVQTNAGQFFVKTNSASRFPGMFEAEAKGLELLAASTSLKIPDVIAFGEVDDESFLLLEFLDSSQPKPAFWETFGTALAQMHRTTTEQFGLDHNNYIGSLPQNNDYHSSWSEFFISERLEAQCRIGRNSGAIDSGTIRQFERLYSNLDNLFPNEPPSLVHGDLWSGNYHIDLNGMPCLIDPAVYFGHREMDIAMTRLFGGFSPEFYSAYTSEWPLADDWEARSDVANLYPLMVHVNLFGGGYVSLVKSILLKFA